jgi:FkbM family methyltransferase
MGIKENLRTSHVARSIRELILGINAYSDSPFKSIVQNIEKTKVSKVLDIGANVGQFGIDIRRHGFNGQIISFEPVKESFEKLSNTIKKHQPWDAFQLGLGAFESQQKIHVSGNAGLSSSLLTMGKIHINNFPESATVSTQKILVSTIDKQLAILGVDPKKILLKLDVQGYESEVLKGTAKSLSQIPLCFLEVSIVPLYEGEVTLLPILNLLSESGHEVTDIFRGLKTKNGELLQIDILTRLTP